MKAAVFRKFHFADIYIYMENGTRYVCCCFIWKTETEAQAIFLNLFTVCSSCKQKFVVCMFVDKEANRGYHFANGLNGLNGLKDLSIYVNL
jgi:hypothetical protein